MGRKRRRLETWGHLSEPVYESVIEELAAKQDSGAVYYGEFVYNKEQRTRRSYETSVNIIAKIHKGDLSPDDFVSKLFGGSPYSSCFPVQVPVSHLRRLPLQSHPLLLLYQLRGCLLYKSQLTAGLPGAMGMGSFSRKRMP